MQKIEEYREEMEASNLAAATIKVRLSNIRKLQEAYDTPIEKRTRKQLISFIGGLRKEKRLASNTIDRIGLDIRSFFRWLGKEKVMDWFKPKVGYKDLDPDDMFTWQDVERLAEVCGIRDAAFITTLMDSGMRLGEFLSLNVEDVRWNGDVARLRMNNSKTKVRTVPVVRCVPYLRKWLEDHPESHDEEAPLWLSSQRKRMSPQTVDYLLKARVKIAGVSKPIGAHRLRHSRATECAKLGWNEEKMRRFFGWSKSSEEPSRYTHLVDGDLEEQIAQDIGAPKPEVEPIATPTLAECPYCQQQSPPSFAFCVNCGRKIDETVQTPMDELMDMLVEENTNLKQKLMGLEEKLSVVMDYVQQQSSQ